MTNWTPVAALTDEPQDQGFWEPWQPRIGDRVRVQLNGECQAPWDTLPRPSTLGRVVNWRGHVDGEDRRVGVVDRCPVLACPLCAGALGHCLSVKFDEALQWGSDTWPGGHYAAGELELLA